MIPRMSLWTIERLRDEMMICALRCKVSGTVCLGGMTGGEVVRQGGKAQGERIGGNMNLSALGTPWVVLGAARLL